MLAGFAIALPLSITAAETLLFLLLTWWLVRIRRRWRAVEADPLWWPVAVFVLAAGASVLWSVRPEATAQRMHRLLIPLAIFAVGAVISEGGRARASSRARAVAGWFVLSCCARGVYDIFRVSRAVSGGADLYTLGNMRDPQMYMAALGMVLAVAPMTGWRGWRPFLACAGGVLALGILLHFKRGVWASVFIAAGWLGLRTHRWRMILALIVMVGVTLAIPTIRGRLLQLADVQLESAGGRRALWQDVAPVLLKQYPWGMGWCAVTHEDLAAHTPYLQPNLNHLHNNLLQIALETGWLGLGGWLVWMGVACVSLYRLSASDGDACDQGVALGVWVGFTGLLLNGMVEYNFGDTEVLMLYTLLLGLASGLGVRSSEFGVGSSELGVRSCEL